MFSILCFSPAKAVPRPSPRPPPADSIGAPAKRDLVYAALVASPVAEVAADLLNILAPTADDNLPVKKSSAPTEAAVAFQEAFGPEFIVEDLTPSEYDTSNRVKVTAPNGKTRTFNTDIGKDEAATAKGEAEAWAKLNNVGKSTGGSGTTATGGNCR